MAAEPDPKPEQPRAPEPWECCQSGCEPCVYDRYWEALTNYEAALRIWESRQNNPLPDPQDEL
jgi:hypothetical protein